MGFKVVEYYIRQVLADGIESLRKNVDELDDVFADMMCPPLGNVFGKKIVDEIKRFFVENDIPVLSAFSQNEIQLPSITVHLISSQEDPEYRSMQDHFAFERMPKRPSILAGPLYASAYDPETGRLTFDKTLDLSEFIRGRKLFAKRSDEVYTIDGTIKVNDPGLRLDQMEDQYIHVVASDGAIPRQVDFAELYLLSSIDFDLYRLAAVYFREVFEIRVNANANGDQAIWLYYICAYILMRNKGKFEEVGLESQTFSTSEFIRDVGKAPNNIWGRTLRFSFLVQHSWKEKVNTLELVQVNVNAETNVKRLLREM